MFIPIRTDRPPKRTPRVTQALVIVNLAVYLLGAAGTYFGLFEDPNVLSKVGHFDPGHFQVWQLFSYQFIHNPHGIDGLLHIGFNMLFLWVFGTAVEDRLTRWGFLAFYLAGGALAGLAHMLVNPHNPVIGASGSIAGVTGAFLALFPRSRIQIIVFFFIGVYNIPSLWFIGFYVVIDFLRQLGNLLGHGGGNVAYMAHIAGYVYGFAVGFLLLATGLLKHEEFDVFYLFRQARRRAAFRAAAREGPAAMWQSAQADTGKRLAREATRQRPPTELEQRLAVLRGRINSLLAAGDASGAADLYRRLLAEAGDASGAVLGEQAQLDVASQLYAQDLADDAATAYELLLSSYPSAAKSVEVRLILALLYTRRLGRPRRARELLEQIRPRLRSETHGKLADQLLAELAP